MEIIVTRTRIAGTLPHYVYRALVSADSVEAENREHTGTVAGPDIVGRHPCVRIAPLIAPFRYFMTPLADRSPLAARIGRVARRIETLVVRTIFPEMTASSVPIVFQLDHDPGEACIWTDLHDLTGAFDRLEPDIEILTAFDLGLRQGDGRRVA